MTTKYSHVTTKYSHVTTKYSHGDYNTVVTQHNSLVGEQYFLEARVLHPMGVLSTSSKGVNYFLLVVLMHPALPLVGNKVCYKPHT